MPLKIVPPRAGKTPYYSIRGTHLGTYLDRSTQSTERAQASRFLRLWKEEIERGRFTGPDEPNFVDAAVAYMADTGNDRFVKSVTEHFGKRALSSITQQDVNEAAIKLYPKASAATRNRQVHTVVSAILKHAGIDWKMKRPKGWRGTRKTDWLTPDQAFRLFKAARRIDEEFGIFLVTLAYTGMRLSEATERFNCARVELDRGFAYLDKTKNEDPRGVHLPPRVVAALGEHPRGMDRRRKNGDGMPVFRFRKNGRLYTLMSRAKKAAGADLSFVTFHVLRHTYGTWMRRYGGLDTKGLVDTGTWRDEASASRYAHSIASEEAQRADLLPVENSWKRRSVIRIGSKIKRS